MKERGNDREVPGVSQLFMHSPGHKRISKIILEEYSWNRLEETVNVQLIVLFPDPQVAYAVSCKWGC